MSALWSPRKWGNMCLTCDMPWYKDPGTQSAEGFWHLAWGWVSAGWDHCLQEGHHGAREQLFQPLRRQASGLVSLTVRDAHSRETLRSIGSRNLDTGAGNAVQPSVCRAMGLSPSSAPNKDQDPKLQGSCLRLAGSGT